MRAPFRAAVITGASSGLGAALARAYAGPGIALGLIGRNAERLGEVAQACRDAGATVDSAIIDVAARDTLAAWLEEFDRAHPVDLVIANAGTSSGSAPGSTGENVEETTRLVMVNLLGAVFTAGPLVPAMCRRGRGRVVFISSIAGYRGLPFSPGYSASKAGLRVYGDALRPLIEPYGVGVTVVSPGFFASRMSDRVDGPRPLMIGTEEAARKIKRAIDRGRRRLSFPWVLAFAARLGDLMPAAIGDRVLSRLHFRIRSP